jgi:hypothetical protein
MSLANELRIGNWVEILGDSKRLDFFTTIQPSSFSVNIDKTYGAIPLDEDWMQKFGFESNYEEFDEKDFPCVVEYWLLTNPVTRFEVDYSVKTGYTVNIANVPTGHALIINTKLQYVHQLQNLFFAVTQTELQFKNDQPNL